MDISTLLTQEYDIRNAEWHQLTTLTHDVWAVHAPDGGYALKIYNPEIRKSEVVDLDIALTLHLEQHGAPVYQLVPGRDGYRIRIEISDVIRDCVLSRWLPGGKPRPETSTYQLLGNAAARIHRAADSFPNADALPRRDLSILVDDTLTSMRPILEDVGQWTRLSELTDRLRVHLDDHLLDFGICHMDLTLDNVHRSGDTLTVFDLESAALTWRAYEPYGVRAYSESFFREWLHSYRSVREFREVDEKAVVIFSVLGDMNNTAWKLGVGPTSHGRALLQPEELPEIIDQWFRWENEIV